MAIIKATKTPTLPVKITNSVTPSELVTNKVHVYCPRCNNEMRFKPPSNWNCDKCNANILDMR